MNTASLALQLQSSLTATASARDASVLGAAAAPATDSVDPTEDSRQNFSGALQDADARRDVESQQPSSTPARLQSPDKAETVADRSAQPRPDDGGKSDVNGKAESRVKNRSERRTGHAAATPAAPPGSTLPPDGKTMPPACAATSAAAAPAGAASAAAHSDGSTDSGDGGGTKDAVPLTGAAAISTATAKTTGGAAAGQSPVDLRAAALPAADAAAPAGAAAATALGVAQAQAVPTAGTAAPKSPAMPAADANAIDAKPGADATAAAAVTQRAAPTAAGGAATAAASAATLAVQTAAELQRAATAKSTAAATRAGAAGTAATAARPSSAAQTDAAVAPAGVSAGVSGQDPTLSSPDAGTKSLIDAAAASSGRTAADSAVTAAAAGTQDPTVASVTGAAAPVAGAAVAAQSGLAAPAERDIKVLKVDGPVSIPAVADAASVPGTLASNPAGAAGAAGAAGGTAADAAVFKLHAGLETTEFPQALADRVSWLVDKDLGGAKLQVNPPQLGPIDVRVEVQGDKAQIWLSAHSVVTRDVLEASSAKLRDMLGSQGFTQVSVDISQRSFQDRPPPAPRFDWAPGVVTSAVDPLVASPGTRTGLLKQGALDAYA